MTESFIFAIFDFFLAFEKLLRLSHSLWLMWAGRLQLVQVVLVTLHQMIPLVAAAAEQIPTTISEGPRIRSTF